MYLSSIYLFEGWSIRYNLTTSNTTTSTSNQQSTKCVVFVHGTPWSSTVFRPIIEALLAKGSYKILVYDLPGYGQSQEFIPSSRNTTSATSTAAFQGDTSVKFQAKALVRLLKHVQLDGAGRNPAPAIIAHDIAGAIVLRAHLLHGAEFDTMMLLDTNAVLPWGDGFYTLVRSDPQPFLRLPPSIFEAVVRAVIRSACYDPNVLQTGWEDELALPWIGGPSDDAGVGERQRSFVRQIAQANDEDVAEMLAGELYERVRCDVKIVWGEQDQWIPREKIEELIRRMNGRVKEWAFIPEAGHLVMLDQPGRFAIEVFDWLTRFGSPRSLATN
ncbi:alpha/beta-hydrolase [Hyaloscypha variabilis]|jgi:pimeloyl-ACP methyl ester carboxylesterase